MARPREFDTEEVLGLVLETFWEKGFEGATLAEIEERTGVKKASLFAAFGDKHALFVQSLQKYVSNGYELLRCTLQGDSPKESIRAWLRGVGGMCLGADGERGCLVVNSMIEVTSSDPEAAEILQSHSGRAEKIIAERVREGIEIGEFRRDLKPAIAAKFLLSSICGLHVMGKSGLKKKQTAGIIDLILASLE